MRANLRCRARAILATMVLAFALPAAAVTRLPSPDISGLTFQPGTPPPRVVGVEPDGKLLLGDVTSVDGIARPGLARILPTNALDTAWNPTLSGPAAVAEVAYLDRSGRWLVSMRTPEFGATVESVLWRFDPATGAATELYRTDYRYAITAVTEDEGGNLYVALFFRSPDSNPEPNPSRYALVHRLDAAGTRDPAFEVRLSGDLGCYALWFTRPRVYSLAHGGGALYIGGTFTQATGAQLGTRLGLAVVANTAAPGQAMTKRAAAEGTALVPKATPGCLAPDQIINQAVAGQDGFLYVAGPFGIQRAWMSPLGGFTPIGSFFANAGINAISLDLMRHRLYATGGFTEANGVARPGLAAFSTLTEQLDAEWIPPAGSAAWTGTGVQAIADRVIHSKAPNSGAMPPVLLEEVVAGYPLAGPDVIHHYYESILGRAPDPSAAGYWPRQIAELAAQGADPREAYIAMAMYFFGSAEFLATPLTDGQYVERLYATFFNRPADPSGIAYWSGRLSSGLSREMLMFAFMFSPEFDTYMSQRLGTGTIRPEVGVVIDFYRAAFGRLPDAAGLGYWVNRFRAAQCGPANQVQGAVWNEAANVAAQFFGSSEYQALGSSHGDYVADLYNAFMRRGAEVEGFTYWVDQLASGALTREQARGAFLGSAEFANRLAAVIAAPCIAPL